VLDCLLGEGCSLKAVCTMCTTDLPEVSPPVYVDVLGRRTGLERQDRDAPQFLKGACSILDVEFERLANSHRDRETAAIRKRVAAVGVERWGQRAGQPAANLNKHPVAVSRWVSEAARQRQEYRGFQRKIDDLDEALGKWALRACPLGDLIPGKGGE